MGVAALGAATLLLGAGCGSAANGDPSAPALQRVASMSLPAGGKGLSRPLPPDWLIKMRAWFPAKRSTLRLEFRSGNVMVFDGSHVWHRVWVTERGLVVDGRRGGTSSLAASSVTLRAMHGPVRIRDLVITRTKS